MNSIVIVLISWAVCIALFILGVYFLTKHAVWFERNSIKFFCIAIILGLGVYLFGYYFREGADFSDQHSSEFSAANLLSSVALSFVSTGRMFMMELDIGELGVIGDVLIYRVIYGFVLLLAVFSLAIVVLSVIGGGVLSNIRLQFLRLLGSRKKFFIICGYRREILTLIQDLRKQHPKNPILLLLKREELDQMEHSEIQAIMNLGCIRSTFKNNGSGISTISTYCFPKRKCPEPICLIAASANTSENAETARIICGALTSQPDYPNRVQLHVLVSYEESEEMMSLACPPSCDLHWSDLEELASRLLLTEYPLWYFLKGTDFSKGCLPMEIRFAVMGYSPLSVWICRNLITEMQFKGCRLKLFWLDDGIEDKAASFKYMNPKISQVADIVCINALPFGNKFFTWLQENAASFHGVFCVYGDDSVNRRTAAAFRNLLPAFQVFYRVHTSTVFDQTAHGICFGTEEQLYSETILLQESLDRLAMAIHEYYGVFYGMSRREARESWQTASVFEKQSSRNLALHMPLKLFSIGYRLLDGTGESDFKEFAEKNPATIQNLAYGEHLRWSASFYVRGWQVGDELSLPSGKTKDLYSKRHACLVPWEELPAVSKQYNIDYQRLDEHFIRNMERIANIAGYCLTKL